MTNTVAVTFPLREQTFTITVAEHDLLVSHPSRLAAAEFLRSQYSIYTEAAEAIVAAVRATPSTITRLPDRKVEVRYPGANSTLEITQAEYEVVKHLSAVRATKFIRDQYQLGLYEAKKCVDAITSSHKLTEGNSLG
jgi:ribosomal protein L7/L12